MQKPVGELEDDPPRNNLALSSRRGNKLHERERNARDRRKLRLLRPYLRSIALSDTERREAGLTKVLNTFTLDLTPLVFLPQRLGRSPILDTATDALIGFPEELALDSAVSTLRNDAFKSYSKALRLIQKSLEQLNTAEMQSAEVFEDLVGAIMVLSFVDIISIHVGWDKATFGSFTHWNGVTSILLSGPPSFVGSDVARSSVDHGGLCNYIIPVYLGRPSPFEGRHWLEAEPASLQTQPTELAELNRTTRRLFIRLPRLICQIREVRSASDASLFTNTFELATKLLRLQDEVAEDWLLHHVNVKATILDEQTRKLVPYSYVYRSCTEMEAGLTYWHSRLTVIQLYLTLAELKSITSGKHEATRSELKKERQRAITNILMSWQYGKTSGYAATAQFNVPLIAIWGVVRQQDSFRDCDIDTVFEWIMAALRQCYCGWIIGTTRDDLDSAANVLIGGPLEGPLVELMRSSVVSIPGNAESTEAG